MKILSLIVPSYNSEQYLDKCISSFLAPEVLDKLDIIIVNDGSVDGTAAVAEKYCAAYPDSVRLISQENKGHGGALNTGFAAALGKYLKPIDADDWVETENLPQFVRLLEACGSDVVLTHHHTIDIATGEIKNWRSFPKEFSRPYSFDEIMAQWKRFDRSLTFHGITYSTAFYRQYGIQLSEHVFYEDHEYATFPCCHAKTVTPFDLFLYDYRVGDVKQSVSEANQLKRISHTETVLKRMLRESGSLTCGAGGKSYAAMKTQGLLLSYLTTALLVDPDRKEGRALAQARMEECKEGLPEAYALAFRKYQVFRLMNQLHISKRSWERILSSWVYNALRG
ncbi:MAG: glycosyltransferase family 2 protein, partial [Faecousia sp.]